MKKIVNKNITRALLKAYSFQMQVLCHHTVNFIHRPDCLSLSLFFLLTHLKDLQNCKGFMIHMQK